MTEPELVPRGMVPIGLTPRNRMLARTVGISLKRAVERAVIEDTPRPMIDTALWVRNVTPDDDEPSDMLCWRMLDNGALVVGIRSHDESRTDPMGEPDQSLFVDVRSFPTRSQSMAHLQTWRGRFDRSSSLRLLAEFIQIVATEAGL